MMKQKLELLPSWLSFAAASIALLPVLPVCAQTSPAQAPQAKSPASPAAAAKPASPDVSASADTNRSVAYYHLALANIYEDEALENGNTDAARLAVDEYKSALNADPESPAACSRSRPTTLTLTSCWAASICAS